MAKTLEGEQNKIAKKRQESSGASAPRLRCRGKTPDPSRGKSPDPKKLKRAEQKTKESKHKETEGILKRPVATPARKTPNPSPTQKAITRKLSFSEADKVSLIEAENPPPRKGKGTSSSRGMSEEEAERILQSMTSTPKVRVSAPQSLNIFNVHWVCPITCKQPKIMIAILEKGFINHTGNGIHTIHILCMSIYCTHILAHMHF